MAVVTLSNDTKTARSVTLAATIDQGGFATLYLYTGPQPANADTALDTQVELAAIACPTPIGTVENGALTGGTFEQHLTTAGTGTAEWARLVNGAGDTVGDFTVGTQGSGANIEIVSTQFYPGVIVSVSSFLVTEV